MNSLRTKLHLVTVSAFWAGYPGMMICAVLENRLVDGKQTFRTGSGRVKDIVI